MKRSDVTSRKRRIAAGIVIACLLAPATWADSPTVTAAPASTRAWNATIAAPPAPAAALVNAASASAQAVEPVAPPLAEAPPGGAPLGEAPPGGAPLMMNDNGSGEALPAQHQGSQSWSTGTGMGILEADSIDVATDNGPVAVHPAPAGRCVIQDLDGATLSGFELDIADTAPGATGSAVTSCSGTATLAPRAGDTATAIDVDFRITEQDGRAALDWAALQRLAGSGATRWEFGASRDVIIEYRDTHITVTRRMPNPTGEALAALVVTVNLERTDNGVTIAESLRKTLQAMDEMTRQILAALAEIIAAAHQAGDTARWSL